MNRSTLDKLISSTGLIVGLVLLAGFAGLLFAHNFIHSQVQKQLSSEAITFPDADSESLAALPEADRAKVSPYAGQQVLTGAQAEVFADHYIAAHLKKIGGGKTYSQLSSESLADPTNTALAAQVNTVFKGETLRGLLLNAYAFDTMATVAYIAAFLALAGGVLLLILSGLGFVHAGRISTAHTRQK